MDLGATTKSLRSIPQAAIEFDAFSPSKHDQNLNGCRGFSSQENVDDPNIFHTPNRETMVDVGNFHIFWDHRNGVFNIGLMGLYI